MLFTHEKVKELSRHHISFSGESESGLQQFIFNDDGKATEKDRQYAKQFDENLFRVFKEHLITNYKDITKSIG